MARTLAHAFVALLKQPQPLLFPDVTYSFYPVWAQLFGLACETVRLDDEMRVRVEDYRREAGSIVIANPNAPTGVALPRAEIARLLGDHPDTPVVIDEAYVDFGGESAVPLIADHPNLLVVPTMSKSRALAGLRVGYALGGVRSRRCAALKTASISTRLVALPRRARRPLFATKPTPREPRQGRRRTGSDDAGADHTDAPW